MWGEASRLHFLGGVGGWRGRLEIKQTKHPGRQSHGFFRGRSKRGNHSAQWGRIRRLNRRHTTAGRNNP